MAARSVRTVGLVGFMTSWIAVTFAWKNQKPSLRYSCSLTQKYRFTYNLRSYIDLVYTPQFSVIYRHSNRTTFLPRATSYIQKDRGTTDILTAAYHMNVNLKIWWTQHAAPPSKISLGDTDFCNTQNISIIHRNAVLQDRHRLKGSG